MPKKTKIERFYHRHLCCQLIGMLLAFTFLSIYSGLAAAESPERPSVKNSKTIYWKQYVFSIPYQIHRKPTDSDAPTQVELLVSTDRGNKWKKVSSVPPTVKGFSYYAPSDGDYWFSIATIDRQGNRWPGDGESSNLHIVVDTHAPKLQIKSSVTQNGEVVLNCHAVDANLSSKSIQIEAQINGSSAWYPIEIPTKKNQRELAGVPFAQQISWRPPRGAKTVAFRASIEDLAGNKTEGRAGATLLSQGGRVAMLQTGAGRNPDSISSPAIAAPGDAEIGPIDTAPINNTADIWPSETTSELHLNLNNMEEPSNNLLNRNLPAETGHKNTAPLNHQNATTDNTGGFQQRHPTLENSNGLGFTTPPIQNRTGQNRNSLNRNNFGQNGNLANQDSQSRWQTIQPNGQGVPQNYPSSQPNKIYRGPNTTQPAGASMPPTGINTNRPGTSNPGIDNSMRMVNSRAFSLEYEVEAIGPWGVGRVELWGTTDQGVTWRRFGIDPDLQSPMDVNVSTEGVYGFKILIHSAGSYGEATPKRGDQPDIWVRIDQARPTATITNVQKGQGNLVDHLTIQWTVSDDNLITNPISLKFASHPAGPWSTIATRLENTSSYTWRMPQHTPENLYLRIEAHDQAGNVGVYSTAEAIQVQRPKPLGRIRGVRAQ